MIALGGWVPAFSFGLNEPVAEVNETLQGAIDRTKARVREVLPVAEYASRDSLVDLERESLERRLEEPLLETLIGHAVFPRYAFPTDVVTFWVSKPRQAGDAPGKRSFDYEPQRDLQLALTEYARHGMHGATARYRLLIQPWAAVMGDPCEP